MPAQVGTVDMSHDRMVTPQPAQYRLLGRLGLLVARHTVGQWVWSTATVTMEV